MFNFGDEFQLGILELMMNDVAFCEKAVLVLKAEYFANQYNAWFFEKFKELREEEGHLPTHTMIRNEIKRFAADKQAQYLKIYKDITEPKQQRSYSYIKRHLEKFCKKAMRWQLNEVLVKNQSTDSDHVDNLIRQHLENYDKANFTTTMTQTPGQLTSIMEQSAQDATKMIPTFMPTMDKVLLGGVPRGTLTLGLAGTNVGKSVWLMNWAYHLIMNGYKVFYVNLEGYEKQTMLRLGARAIGVPFGKVRFNNLTDIEMQKRSQFEKETNHLLQIFHNSTFGFTIEDLVPIIRQKKEEYDFDICIVDYGQILGSKKKFSELRHEQAHIHRALAATAGELDVAMATVAQGNRNTQIKNDQGSQLVRISDIAECFEIIRACATVFTLNRSEKDIEMETARVLLDKSRDGVKNVIEVMKTNMNRMAFYGPSDEGLGFMLMQDYVHQSALKEAQATG